MAFVLDQPPMTKKNEFRRKRFIPTQLSDDELEDFFDNMVTY